MFEVFRYETERRLRGTVVLSVLIAAFGAMMVAFFPSIQGSGPAIGEYIDQIPEFFREAFGIQDLTSIGGFLAAELYQFGWVLLLGIYFAYRAASLIAADVETHRLDLLLAAPISRTRVLFERFAALLPVMILVNLIVMPVVYVGTVVVGEPVAVAPLVAVHALSIPYFLACAGIGVVLSVLTDSEGVANRVALGLLFALFVFDTLSSTAGYDLLGAVSPTRYYDPTTILVATEYDLLGGLILLVGAAGLLLVARELFVRADIE